MERGHGDDFIDEAERACSGDGAIPTDRGVETNARLPRTSSPRFEDTAEGEPCIEEVVRPSGLSNLQPCLTGSVRTVLKIKVVQPLPPFPLLIASIFCSTNRSTHHSEALTVFCRKRWARK